jgi:hypothetical protein
MAGPKDFVLPIITLGEDGSLSADQLDALRDACAKHGVSASSVKDLRGVACNRVLIPLFAQFLLLSNKRSNGSSHISPEVLAEMWAVAAELFDRPLAAKQVQHAEQQQGCNSIQFHCHGCSRIELQPLAA